MKLQRYVYYIYDADDIYCLLLNLLFASAIQTENLLNYIYILDIRT